MPQRPNIVFILTDQMRGDCLSVAGHPVIRTPTLDMFARQGTLFTRACASVPSCIAARACMWTGQSASTTGRLGYRDAVPWRYPVTLMSALANGGYQCHCVGKTHFYPQGSLMGFHSMETYEASQNHDGDYVNDYFEWLNAQPGGPWQERMTGLDSNSWVAAPSDLPEHLHNNSWTITRGIEFVRRRDPTRPFFLNVSFHRPHAPVDPPNHYFHMYDGAALPPVPIGDWAERYGTHPVDGVNASCGRIAEDELDRLRRAYWGQISHIDAQINRLVIVLRLQGLLDNTILIFLSDHGELLGDHYLFRKTHAFEGSAKIPLIVAAPKGWNHPQSAVSDLPVTHMDLMPTVLEMAGLPIPDRVEGESLLPIVAGKAADWREYVHGEHASMGAGEGNQFVVGRRYKYVWFTKSGEELLFDLANDPHELHNLAADSGAAKLTAEWRARLVTELAKRPQDGLTDGDKLVRGKSLPAVRPELLEPFYDNEGRPRPAGMVSRFD